MCLRIYHHGLNSRFWYGRMRGTACWPGSLPHKGRIIGSFRKMVRSQSAGLVRSSCFLPVYGRTDNQLPCGPRNSLMGLSASEISDFDRFLHLSFGNRLQFWTGLARADFTLQPYPSAECPVKQTVDAAGISVVQLPLIEILCRSRHHFCDNQPDRRRFRRRWQPNLIPDDLTGPEHSVSLCE